jgi:hypothetical protein
MMDRHINSTLIELEKSYKNQQAKKEVRDTKDIKQLLLNKNTPSLADDEKELLLSIGSAPKLRGTESTAPNKLKTFGENASSHKEGSSKSKKRDSFESDNEFYNSLHAD